MGLYMAKDTLDVTAEAQQLWNQMSEEFRSGYPRELVPQLIEQREELLSSLPKYPIQIFSAINWAFGAVCMLLLPMVLLRHNDIGALAIRGGLLVFVMVVSFAWYRYTMWYHTEHENELIAHNRSVDSIRDKLSDFVRLVKGQSATADPAAPQVHSMMPPWLSSETANMQLRLLAIQVCEAEASANIRAYNERLMHLITQVNRACELGVEPVSRLGPVDGLSLLLEVAHSTPSAAS